MFKWLKQRLGLTGRTHSGSSRKCADLFVRYGRLMSDMSGEEFETTSRFNLCEALRIATNDLVDRVYEGQRVQVTTYALHLSNLSMAIACEFGDLLEEEDAQ